LAKHRGERHRTKWKLQLRWYKYLVEYHGGRLVRAYITRGNK
jgi:hypothetical protein